jgi:signal transduction histidine kinase
MTSSFAVPRSPSDGIAPVQSAMLVLTVGIVTYLAGPLLGHFPFAVIPWPVHGLALAALFAARPRHRVAVIVALLAVVSLGAALHSGQWLRSVAAASQLMAQSIVITEMHRWLTRGRHPLRGTIAYALLGVAAVFGSIPPALISAAAVQSIGLEIVPGFTAFAWWVAAVTSIFTITPIVLAPSAPFHPEARASAAAGWEFPAVAILYAFALMSAYFADGGIPALPPAVATVPFLVWAGLRFGVRGYAVFSAMFLAAVIASTIMNIGPFSEFGPDPIERGRRAWIYLASLAGPTMIFPIALAERAAAEARARGAFAQLSAIIESSADPIAAVDRDLIVIAANPSWVEEFRRISGVTVKPGMPMADAVAALTLDGDDALSRWRQTLRGERLTVTREIGDPSRARDEYEITYSPVLDERGDVVGASQVVRNVSTRRRMDEAAADASRLEALGRLAGGVAHDFNNLMTAVVGYTGLIAQSLPAGDPQQADLAEIEKAATRAGELTQQLLAFARRRVIEPKLVDVSGLVQGFMRLISPLFGSAVRLRINTAEDLPPVRLDPVQFEQVLMNLAVNARDAMPNGGDLSIEVAPTAYRGGQGVRLSVRDTGVGMSAEVLAHIWEPFYTTKEFGRGTGLGLATVHGLVHQAGGEIGVESTLGVGTVFHVLLPSASQSAADSGAK